MKRLARASLALLLGAALGVPFGCRAVLGIDENRNLLPPDAEVPEADVPDADDAGDAMPTSAFCDSLSPPPAFCADFDQGVVAKGWENEGKVPDPGEFGGGHITLDTMNARSTPASAAFDLPALVTSKAQAAAFLLQPFAPVPTAVRVDFDVFIATEYMPPKTAGNVVIASLHFLSTCSVEIVRDSVGTALAVYVGATGTNTSVVAFAQPIPVGAWRRVTLFVHRDEDAGTNGIAQVSVDNLPSASAPIPTDFRAGAKQMNLSLGAPYAEGPIGPFRANIDNVRLYTIE